MSNVGGQPSPHQQALDWLFARLGGGNDAPPELEGRPVAPPTPAPPTPAPPSAPPLEVRTPEDLRVAAAWIQRERERLEGYTRSQLGRIQEEHKALLERQHHQEQQVIVKLQELACKEALVLSQGQAVRQQAEELARREQAFAAQFQERARVREPETADPDAPSPPSPDDAEHRALLGALKAEQDALHQAREAAREDLLRIQAADEALRLTRLQEEANLQARHAQLEKRLQEADRAALAAEQRLAELDDLELRLRQEVEDQDRDLRRQRHDLDAQLGQLQQRLRAAEQAEQAARQRQIELERLQQSLEEMEEELRLREQDLARRGS